MIIKLFCARSARMSRFLELIRIHETFRGQLKTGNSDMAEDHRFNRKIAALSKNPVPCWLIALIARSTDADLKKQINNPPQAEPKFKIPNKINYKLGP